MRKILFKSKNNSCDKHDIISVTNPAEFKNIDITKIQKYAFAEPFIRNGMGMSFSTQLELMYKLGGIN